jgi:hypothetical protein
MQVPDSSSYRDIVSNTDVPVLAMENIVNFLRSNSKSFEDKYKKLYEERYVQFVRISNADDQLYYITGSVWAEMKRTVKYKIDLSINSNGVVVESQCECGAGQGPAAHCKHIVTVLYGLHRLSVDGSLLTELTCTQVLQTFHHCRPYTGKPLSPAVLFDQKNMVFDPRPESYRKSISYPDHVRNTVLNYRGIDRMPISQLFTPANPYALVDHISQSPEETFLKDFGLISMSQKQVQE